MPKIELECPEEVLRSLKEDPAAFANDLRWHAAIKFYELGRLSSGRAAELAGVSRVTFLRRLSEFGASAIDETRDELERDADNA